MPIEIRLFLRTSLVSLVLASIAGTLLYAWPAVRGVAALWTRIRGLAPRPG